MLDLRAIREDPAPFREALKRRGAADDLDHVLELDDRRRQLVQQVESLRAEQNRGSKDVASASPSERGTLIERLKGVSDDIKALEPLLADVEAELEEAAARLPNIPDPDAPDGVSDEDNVELRRWGAPPSFEFEPRDHVQLGESLRMIDIERGARTSGSRFYYLTGAAVRLEFALLSYGLDFAERNGMTPVTTPALVACGPTAFPGAFRRTRARSSVARPRG